MAGEAVPADDLPSRAVPEDDLPRAASAPPSRPLTGRMSRFISGNLNKGIAETADSLLNVPNRVGNLLRAAQGTVATAVGRPDFAPPLNPDPDYAQKGMEKAGLITPDAEAETTGQKLGAGALQLAGGMAVPMGKGKPGAFKAMEADAAAAAAERQANRASFDKTLQESRKLGYVVPPSQVSSSVTGNAVEGMVARTAPTERVASIKNATVTNRVVKRDLGLTPTQPVTDATFEALRKDAGQAYDAVKKSGVQIKPDKEFEAALEKLKTSDYGTASKEYGELLGNEQVDKLVAGINKEASPTAAVEMVKELRRRATKNLKAWDDLEKQDLGYAQRAAAGALEDLIGRSLEGAGKGKLVGAWKEARTTIAKVYDAEAAWDGSNFSAKELAKLKERGAPLSGGMEQAAEFARHFPRAAQDVTKLPQKSGFSQYDAWLGGGGAAAAAAMGHNPLIGAAAVGVPWLTQHALLSKAGQRIFASTPNYKVGPGMRAASSLDEMAQRAAVQGVVHDGEGEQ